MKGFARVIPKGDILPVRARFSPEMNDWQVAVNYLYAENTNDALWFSVPDIVTSVLLTKRIPEIVDAFRLEPSWQLKGLKPTKLRSAVEIDPREQDFFRIVIEERKRTEKRTDLSDIEKDRLSGALKVFANSTSYGIYGQMDWQESEQKIFVRCYGIDAKPYTCRVANPEKAGEYCFPPLASLITGAVRLMLGLLEHSVTEVGGTYAMEDTDSMAIVSTENGGLVRCPGGPQKLRDGSEGVKSLSWKQVDELGERFKSLCPYDPQVISTSILKIEDDNFDPKTRKQRQLWCVAISAKRDALFLRDGRGAPVLLRASCPHCGRKNKGTATTCNNKDCARPIEVNNDKDRWSEHGLGHLLNPSDPESEDRDWIAQVWLNLVRSSLGLRKKKLEFETIPAVGRITVSSPAVMQPLEFLNRGKKYSEQIKPFNFLMSCHIRPLGHPLGVDPARFHLIAPYETNPQQWLQQKWIDQYTEQQYRISTSANYSSRQTARVKTFEEVISEYEFHPESKCAGASGKCATRQTEGLLQRRHIRIDSIKYIGKESNSLEEVDSGLIHSTENVYTEYADQRRDEWETKIRPALNTISLSVLQKETGLGRRTLIYARTGKKRPHPKNQAIIKRAVRTLQRVTWQ